MSNLRDLFIFIAPFGTFDRKSVARRIFGLKCEKVGTTEVAKVLLLFGYCI